MELNAQTASCGLRRRTGLAGIVLEMLKTQRPCKTIGCYDWMVLGVAIVWMDWWLLQFRLSLSFPEGLTLKIPRQLVQMEHRQNFTNTSPTS